MYLSFQKTKPKIFIFTRVMFDFLRKKNDILGVCVEENMVKKLKHWSHCLRIQQKRAHTKENWHYKGKCEHVQTN